MDSEKRSLRGDDTLGESQPFRPFGVFDWICRDMDVGERTGVVAVAGLSFGLRFGLKSAKLRPGMIDRRLSLREVDLVGTSSALSGLPSEGPTPLGSQGFWPKRTFRGRTPSS